MHALSAEHATFLISDSMCRRRYFDGLRISNFYSHDCTITSNKVISIGKEARDK